MDLSHLIAADSAIKLARELAEATIDKSPNEIATAMNQINEQLRKAQAELFKHHSELFIEQLINKPTGAD